MKKLLSAMAAVSLMANAAVAAEVESKAGAKIVAPLQISNVSALYFGTVAPSLTADDSVVVSPAGAKTCGAELTCLTDDHTAAKFEVTGEADASYTIDLPNTIQIANGNGASMTVDGFTGSKSNGTLASGADDFTVGGTLAVAANQAAGDYTGAFTVAVEYQ
ncbi:MAG: DUF4402 domain-containing protein [Alphaproteobacteria bacterium]|jgi:hypothetical protein|nr:DUF4402 domain-containing protein [Alphaproteobacteria bacterium]